MISNLMGEVKINGWNMLDSYQEGQAIYGRDSEITSISDSIEYNVQTFIYGKSGIGKTSLIQAGVFPKLRKAHMFPIVIRLAFYDENNEPLSKIIKRLVIEEAENENIEIGKVALQHHVIDNSDVSASSLYEFFSKVAFEDKNNTPYIPVLVFDQFEETINNEENWQRTVDFLKDELYDLMDNSNVSSSCTLPYTNYRVVISMREDYLYCLEDIVDQYSLWELRYNRFRIKALDDIKASEVISRTSGISGLEDGKEDLIIRTIIRIVKLNSGTRFTEINTALLSLVCSLLYEKSIDKCIHYDDLRNINIYLHLYYDDICDQIGSKATRYLENHLLTTDGRRSSMDETEALNSGKIDEESLDYLVKKRLLRRIKTDNTSVRYEYIHDLFAKMVFKQQQEDKTKWFYPDLRKLSKRIDRSTFNRKFTLTLLLSFGICLLYLLIHSRTAHEQWSFFSKYEKNGCQGYYYCNVVYWLMLALSVFILPIVTQRLHDVNKSGWLCFIIPLSLFLINCNHFDFLSQYGTALIVCKVIGVISLLYFLWLCTKTGIQDPKRTGYSREYESIFNLKPIRNIEFVKAFSLELLWWFVMCCMTDMLYGFVTNVETWHFFKINLPVPLLDKFGVDLDLPAVLSQLPIIFCISPALRARVKSLGYPIWLSFIPYFNILLFVEGVLPDKLLMTIGLISTNRNKSAHHKSDDVFAEISDDFTINEDVLYTSQINKNFNVTTILIMLFVPLYGITKGFDRRQKIGVRSSSMGFAFINSSILYLLWAYFAIDGFFDSIPNVWGWISLLLIAVLYIISLVGLLINDRKEKDAILQIVSEHPSYSINQIAHELVLKPSALEKVINRMKKKGEIARVAENGQLIWKVNEPSK